MKICNSCMQLTVDSSDRCPVCKMADFTSLAEEGARREKEISKAKERLRVKQKHTQPSWKPRNRRSFFGSKLGIVKSVSAVAASFLALSVVLNSTVWSSPENPLDVRAWLEQNLTIDELVDSIVSAGAEQLGISSPTRLLPTVSYNSNGQFKFLAYDSEGNPTGFHSPCEPIRYEINPAHEPEGAREILEAAIQAMRYHTGLEFEFVGETDELIQHNEPIPVVNPPSTLLINYYPTEVFEALPRNENYEHVDDVAGWGGPRSYQDLNPGKKQYRALGGVMGLDSDYISQDISQGLWGEPRGKVTFALMIHELAHVVGLDHVDAKSEIMYLDSIEVTEFQAGDKEGLSIAGQGACGSDVSGNLIFGEDVSELGTNVPKSCVVEELRDTHEMFELRQESDLNDRACAMNPFPQSEQELGLQVNFRWTNQSAESFLSAELETFHVGDRPIPFVDQREFRGQECSVLAIYSQEVDPIPSYWLYVVCGENVTVIRGYNFNPNRYFESPTLQAIVKHSQNSP